MTVTVQPSLVDVRPDLTAGEFHAEYVNRKPVLMRGALAQLPATERWTLEYFASRAPQLPVRLKTGTVANGATTWTPLADYHATVAKWEQEVAAGAESSVPPAYLHDVPLLRLIPDLREDLEPFPAHFFPKFFRDSWWEFPQFFVGPSRACTPLHFDTLLTHNLFFQFEGRKRFLMVDSAYRDRCYTYNWRWSAVDPDAPDYSQHPRFAGVPLMECEVNAGDLFYMPPGTLHKVTSLSASISFNIDWHDHRSALHGLTAVLHGMPLPNLRYNSLFALGVWGRMPLQALLPLLRSYFTYIS